MSRPTVGVVGLGLIGGSLARGLRRAGYTVIGFDRPAVRRRARAAGAVSALAESFSDVARADLVVLAAPPTANVRMLRRLAGLGRPDLVVTDVGSVKAPICAEAARLGLRSFVGGHPMAGNEGSGFGASSPDLFRGRPWVLTPDGAAERAVRRVTSVARAVGARPLLMSAREHDRTVALLSHLPQLLAWALLETASGDPVVRRHLRAAGPAFRDMTRLARSPRPLWREILAQNRREVRRALARFRRALKPTA